MPRRRYQHGQLYLEGKKKKMWVARWREDVILPDGKVNRVRKKERLGTLKEYPTRRLAERELERRLSEVNSLTYRPRPTATFGEFALKWQRDVLTLHKRSTGSADRSRLRKHLIPELGDLCMKDVTAQRLQALVATKSKSLGAKSVKNLITLVSMMWAQAKAWGYVDHDPFVGLVLPEREPLNEPCLSPPQMSALISAAEGWFQTYLFVLSEVGPRAGEIGALKTTSLDLDRGVIRITQSVWGGQIQTVKTRKGNRIAEISPQLVEHLRGYLLTNWKPNALGLLFPTSNDTPWDIDTLRKRKLYPLLEKLNIPRCGFHAFRHGNATEMDQSQVPMATRQNRLGHSDPRTTMGYTDAISEDGRRFAAHMGALLTAPLNTVQPAGSA